LRQPNSARGEAIFTRPRKTPWTAASVKFVGTPAIISQPLRVMIDPHELGVPKMFDDFMDHGLPLVDLKEQRRDLIVALMKRKGPISKEAINEIAALQHVITAIEAVIVDLDAEIGPLSYEDAEDRQSRH
jgi:hypothetical protein